MVWDGGMVWAVGWSQQDPQKTGAPYPLSFPVASSHSARYFLTAVSEPGQGLPQFTVVAYIDDQLIGYYDSNRRRIVSSVPWVQKIEKEDPQLWDIHTQKAQNEELYLGWHLADVQKLHNQSGGERSWEGLVKGGGFH